MDVPLEDVLVFVIGCDEIPLGGFESQPKLEFEHSLPTASTCSPTFVPCAVTMFSLLHYRLVTLALCLCHRKWSFVFTFSLCLPTDVYAPCFQFLSLLCMPSACVV